MQRSLALREEAEKLVVPGIIGSWHELIFSPFPNRALICRKMCASDLTRFGMGRSHHPIFHHPLLGYACIEEEISSGVSAVFRKLRIHL
jgi:hypothetical protein